MSRLLHDYPKILTSRLHKTRNLRQDNEWPFYSSSLKINLLSFLKMYYYVRAANGEISGLGKIKIIKDNIPIVTKVMIFEQECSSVSTELSADAISKFIVALIKKNIDPLNWRLWWHSHNDFSVGWSGIDEKCISELSQDALLFSICMNKNGDIIARADERGNTSELYINILPTGHNDLREKCKNEVGRKVKIMEDNIIDLSNQNPENAVVINEDITTEELRRLYGLY